LVVFAQRSHKLERIDTGDYTQAEYERFLREIRFINQRLGDSAALRASLLRDIEEKRLTEFSVLDVGAGSGELLKEIAEFARRSSRGARLAGLDLNEISAQSVKNESRENPEISAVRGNALTLPFADGAFDYAICSLFTHHLTDAEIPLVLGEMSRVASRGIVVIDLERSAMAWFLYRLFCLAFRISPLVKEDGLLSIRKGFRVNELQEIGNAAGLKNVSVRRHSPYRVVLKSVPELL
jgi:ubiquinone/menaquinone biosynthesis C-methylase UbiE